MKMVPTRAASGQVGAREVIEAAEAVPKAARERRAVGKEKNFMMRGK